MRVETLDGNDKVASRTYLRLDKPSDKPPTGRRPDGDAGASLRDGNPPRGPLEARRLLVAQPWFTAVSVSPW